jgi:lipopolysaccharide/colanic/teichoic acid biosynthesis glycosyltransferase
MPYTEIKKSGIYESLKRLMDIVFALTILTIFSPVILITAIAIKIDTKGPILADTPQRVGKGGNLFKMYKFRSMIQNAHTLLRNNPKYSKLYHEYKRGSINKSKFHKGKF